MNEKTPRMGWAGDFACGFDGRRGGSSVSNRRSGAHRLQKLRVLYVRNFGRHAGRDRYRGAGGGVQLGRASERSPPHHRARSDDFSGSDAPRAFGIGDIELGIKYRFVQEGKHRPMIGTFTMFEIPTGSAARGLGVGKTWYKVPLWVQKSFGPWTTYGGGGVTVVSVPGYRNFPFAGWLVQRDIGKKWTLGTEVFYHGPEGPAGAANRAGDAGRCRRVLQISRSGLSVAVLLRPFRHRANGELRLPWAVLDLGQEGGWRQAGRSR